MTLKFDRALQESRGIITELKQIFISATPIQCNCMKFYLMQGYKLQDYANGCFILEKALTATLWEIVRIDSGGGVSYSSTSKMF